MRKQLVLRHTHHHKKYAAFGCFWHAPVPPLWNRPATLTKSHSGLWMNANSPYEPCSEASAKKMEAATLCFSPLLRGVASNCITPPSEALSWISFGIQDSEVS